MTDGKVNYIEGNLCDFKIGVVVHGVNCQGRMGSGVALAIRNEYPEAYNRYMMLCKNTTDKAKLLNTSQFVTINEQLVVGNLFTQVNYGYDGKKYADLQAIKRTLEDSVKMARAYNLPLYTPLIGSKRGGLDWNRDVKPVVEHLAVKYSDVQINVVTFTE